LKLSAPVGDKTILAFRPPSSTTGISTKCMLTWYADTTHAGSSRGCRLTESVLEPANMEFAVSDNLDRVLVLSYTEFVQQPVQDGGGGVKNGCTEEGDRLGSSGGWRPCDLAALNGLREPTSSHAHG
jgi:hypothetical protein